MKNLIIYVHGKGGSAGEAEYYKMFFPNSEVIGFDYCSQTLWEAKKEFFAFLPHREVGLSTLPWLQTASGLSLGYPRWMKRWLTELI